MKKLALLSGNILFLCFFSNIALFSQVQTTSDTSRMDILYFLNGEVRAVKVVDTIAHLIRFLPGKKKARLRVLDTEKSKVFSVKFSDGKESVFYFQDSLSGNMLSVLEAKMFMLGEQEAERSYHNKWPFLIGLTAGITSPVVFSNAVLISPAPAALVPLHTLVPVIKINAGKIKNKNYLQYDTYLMGYEKVARKKNFINSLIGAGVGLGIGFATWAVPDKAWNALGADTSNPAYDGTFKTFVKKNYIYAVWTAQFGCAVGISIAAHRKHNRSEK